MYTSRFQYIFLPDRRDKFSTCDGFSGSWYFTYLFNTKQGYYMYVTFIPFILRYVVEPT